VYETIRTPEKYKFGSADHFIALEKFFGGYTSHVPRRAVSPHDHRTTEEIASGGMTGGDRMFHHGYAPAYAAALAPFLADHLAEYTIVEVGILRGTGLAMWSSLFPNARVIGLDVDVSHTEENLPALRTRGAFSRRLPELHHFDQLASTEEDVAQILGGSRIDICVDDGLHTDASIIGTAQALRPYLNTDAVYFVEDTYIAAEKLQPIIQMPLLYKNNPLTIFSTCRSEK
jgi:hypothetical protein